jgi:hypothetical protein
MMWGAFTNREQVATQHSSNDRLAVFGQATRSLINECYQQYFG